MITLGAAYFQYSDVIHVPTWLIVVGIGIAVAVLSVVIALHAYRRK